MGRRTHKAKSHPHQELDLAIHHALDHGWELVRGEDNAYATWGRLVSPDGIRAVWLPPGRNGATGVAHQLRSEVDQLRWNADRVTYHAVPLERRGTDPDENEGSAELGRVIAAFTSLSDQLLRALADDPKLLYGLHWRDFEELVAHLLVRQGLEVQLTPGSRDRGVDIYARHYGPTGPSLYVVECKRYGPQNPVGPDLVRLLYGVVERERATKGLLVTSSYFTRDAEREAGQELAYRLWLRDGAGVSQWIKNAEQLERDAGHATQTPRKA